MLEGVGDVVAVGSLISLVGYVLYFISKADGRLFGLADRQAAEIKELKTRLDTEEKLTDDLRKQVRKLDNTLGSYILGTRILIQQIRNLGHDPMWVPPEDEVL